MIEPFPALRDWRRRGRRGGVLLAAALMAPPAADAQTVDSAYTSLAVENCALLDSDPMGGRWACQGFDGWTVVLSEFDLRQTLVLQRDGRELGPAPRIMAFNRAHDLLEWRLREEAGNWRPFALILRFFVADLTGGPEGAPDRQWLYVLRLDGGAGVFCTAGIVEASGNPDANAEARALADALLDTPPGTSCRAERGHSLPPKPVSPK